MSNNNILCSFCGANQAKVDILIEGESAYICNNCIIKSFNVISESKYDKEIFSQDIKPHTIKSKLDKYIIGQDKVKKSVSVAVYNHYKRLLHYSKSDKNKFSKPSKFGISE